MKTEIPSDRTAKAKVFDLGAGKKRVEVDLRQPKHTPDDFAAYQRGDPVTWQDIDAGYDNQAGEYVLRNHWMRFNVAQSKVGWRYQSRLNSETVQVELMRLNGQTLPPINPPVLIDNNWTWVDVVSGLDIYLVASAGKVSAYKRLKTNTAPTQFSWKVTESTPGSINIQYDTRGHDNADLADATRDGELPGNLRRSLIMLSPVLTSQGPGVTRFDEEWSGKVIQRDADRVPFESLDVSYPVLIDADIDENITAENDNDDGYSLDDVSPTWEIEYGSTGNGIIWDSSGGTNYRPGFRFQTIPTIASGDTIDAGTILTINMGSGGSTAEPTATVYGSDEDSATAWSDSHRPGNMTQTTASAAFGTWGSDVGTSTKNITVTSIVQEIVDRVGWAADNHIAFGIDFPNGGSNVFHYTGDVAAGGESPATLAINFTAAAGGIIPLIMYHRRSML